MRRAGACLLPVVLAFSCSGRDDAPPAEAHAPTTIVVDQQTIEVAPLTEAVAGLCQARVEAANDTRAATTTYDRRSRPGIDTTVRLLQPSNARLASSLVAAIERVEADLAAGPASPALASDLARLTELLREGLARLGLPTPACAR